MENARLAVIAT